ncbi:hypothetical protein EDB83DRAFT_2633333 [Lactarius deliciosus]|nr:hypothetical protein EDB83DRAFT_2633333 [Lactarius deliciosus]
MLSSLSLDLTCPSPSHRRPRPLPGLSLHRLASEVVEVPSGVITSPPLSPSHRPPPSPGLQRITFVFVRGMVISPNLALPSAGGPFPSPSPPSPAPSWPSLFPSPEHIPLRHHASSPPRRPPAILCPLLVPSAQQPRVYRCDRSSHSPLFRLPCPRLLPVLVLPALRFPCEPLVAVSLTWPPSLLLAPTIATLWTSAIACEVGIAALPAHLAAFPPILTLATATSPPPQSLPLALSPWRTRHMPAFPAATSPPRARQSPPIVAVSSALTLSVHLGGTPSNTSHALLAAACEGDRYFHCLLSICTIFLPSLSPRPARPLLRSHLSAPPLPAPPHTACVVSTLPAPSSLPCEGQPFLSSRPLTTLLSPASWIFPSPSSCFLLPSPLLPALSFLSLPPRPLAPSSSSSCPHGVVPSHSLPSQVRTTVTFVPLLASISSPRRRFITLPSHCNCSSSELSPLTSEGQLSPLSSPPGISSPRPTSAEPYQPSGILCLLAPLFLYLRCSLTLFALYPLIPPLPPLVTISPALVPSPRPTCPSTLAVAAIVITTLPSSPAPSAYIWKVRKRGAEGFNDNLIMTSKSLSFWP